MQQVRVVARRKYTPEEKVRIVLEGFRREVAVNELCRREGIKMTYFLDSFQIPVSVILRLMHT